MVKNLFALQFVLFSASLSAFFADTFGECKTKSGKEHPKMDEAIRAKTRIYLHPVS